jgi:hypothetical protein
MGHQRAELAKRCNARHDASHFFHVIRGQVTVLDQEGIELVCLVAGSEARRAANIVGKG